MDSNTTNYYSNIYLINFTTKYIIMININIDEYQEVSFI